MNTCNLCGESGGLLYSCSYCTGRYCADHRLPEEHACPGQGYTNPPGRDRIDNAASTSKDGQETLQKGSTSDEPSEDSRRSEMSVEELNQHLPGDTSSPEYDSSPDRNPDGSLATSSPAKSIKAHNQRRSGKTALFYAVLIIIIPLAFIALFIHGGGLASVDSPVANGTPDIQSQPTDSERGGQVAAEETATSSATPTADAELDSNLAEKKIHEYVNDQRQANGLDPLAFDDELAAIARYHSKDMAERGYFAHTSPDGMDFGDRYSKFGYDCRVSISSQRYATGGENIAKTYAFTRVQRDDGPVVVYENEDELARGVVNQWMQSPGHRENLLGEYWENEGIGVYVAEEDGEVAVHVTQNFC